MTDLEKAALRKNYVVLSMYYQRQLDDAVISLYVEDLQDLPIDQVQAAMTKYRKDPKNKTLPLPGQIRAIISPPMTERDVAESLLARARHCVSRFGTLSPSSAQAEMGEIGWEIIRRMGGWNHLCHGNFDVGVYRSQFLNCAESLLKVNAIEAQEALKSQPRQIEPPKEILLPEPPREITPEEREAAKAKLQEFFKRFGRGENAG